jgi:hypothetical protein
MVIMQILQLLAAGSPASPSGLLPDRRRESANAARIRINDWVQTSPAPQFGLLPSKFADRLRILVDAPQSLRQGNYPWCLPAAFVNSVLRRFPDEMVRFALDLYATGSATLGSIDVTMPREFRAFDFAADTEAQYQSALASGQVLPQVALRNRDLFLAAHTDWLLLAAFEQETRSPFSDVTGTVRDAGANASISAGTLAGLFDDCGLYESTERKSTDSRRVLQEISLRTATEDVALVAEMVKFFAGGSGLGRHAVRLAEPITIPAGASNVAFKCWSWGMRPDSVKSLPFDEPENAFTFQVPLLDFDEIDFVFAKPKAI